MPIMSYSDSLYHHSNCYRKRRAHDERDVASGRYPKKLAMDMSQLTLGDGQLLERRTARPAAQEPTGMEGIELQRKNVVYIDNLERELEEISREEQLELKHDGTIKLLGDSMKRPPIIVQSSPLNRRPAVESFGNNTLILWQPDPYQILKTEKPVSVADGNETARPPPQDAETMMMIM